MHQFSFCFLASNQADACHELMINPNEISQMKSHNLPLFSDIKNGLGAPVHFFLTLVSFFFLKKTFYSLN